MYFGQIHGTKEGTEARTFNLECLKNLRTTSNQQGITFFYKKKKNQ